MKLDLIPQPKRMVSRKGRFVLPQVLDVVVSGTSLLEAAQAVRDVLGVCTVRLGRPQRGALWIGLSEGLQPGGYRLAIGKTGIALRAQSAAAAFHGVQTLIQIFLQQTARTLPFVTITDWPDFQDRGVYYDVARGRVPTLESLMEMACLLSHYKINQLQLYIEHTFRFEVYPEIGRGASPLTAQDIRSLDAFCRQRHIELVPSLASFGHLSPVLTLKQFRHLAEDRGVGRYDAPEADALPAWQRRKGWTLSPANPEVYEFLDTLFAEFLPCFSSKRFNVCCDETWDLGLGQSYEICKRKGKGRVYLDHIKKLRTLAAKYGKTIMFWGDIIRKYPDLIPEIPKDVTVLDWGYSCDHPFGRIRDFKKAGVPFYACPGTHGWCSLFPLLPEAMANIHGFAAAAKRNGAQGLLNTDWGDGGHYNFMEYSWHGYLFGAEQGWHVGPDTGDFTRRFARLFLGSKRADLVKAIRDLGDIAQTRVTPYYQGVWQHVLFAPSTDDIFQPVWRPVRRARNGRLEEGTIVLNAALGRRTRERLARIRSVFVSCVKERESDPYGIVPYWIFAIDTLACAARKLTVFGQGGRNTAASRCVLKRKLEALMVRFEELWMAQNRRSEIRMTLKRYKRAIEEL